MERLRSGFADMLPWRRAVRLRAIRGGDRRYFKTGDGCDAIADPQTGQICRTSRDYSGDRDGAGEGPERHGLVLAGPAVLFQRMQDQPRCRIEPFANRRVAGDEPESDRCDSLVRIAQTNEFAFGRACGIAGQDQAEAHHRADPFCRSSHVVPIAAFI